jgi:hypothetical protein
MSKGDILVLKADVAIALKCLRALWSLYLGHGDLTDRSRLGRGGIGG